jgi:hypothetical protein
MFTFFKCTVPFKGYDNQSNINVLLRSVTVNGLNIDSFYFKTKIFML